MANQRSYCFVTGRYSIGGLWFTHQYFKGGTTRSTTYHAVYNSMLVAALFVSLFIIT
jgi:hypothetical protein